MLASLMSFSARQDTSTLKNLDSQPVKGMSFYQQMLAKNRYWSYSLQFVRLPRTQKINSEKSRQSTLKMAGERYPVSSEQVYPEERNPNGSRRYIVRMGEPYGYHNGSTFEDCIF